LPRHCTHEVIGVDETPTGVLIREYWLCRFDAEALHFNQLYFAAIVASILRLTGADAPLFRTLRLVPHPETGLDHVSAWCGCPVEASRHPHIELEVDTGIADARFDPERVGPALPSVPSNDEWPRLRRSYMVSDSVAVVIEAMLGVGAVSIDRVAAASDMPVRTLQRQLADEGTDFSALLDRARKAKAMELLAEGSSSLADIARTLGYANPPAFTRAFRRWTGETPRGFQRRQGPI
jgi:AraC-like DNA-binding protein